MDPFTEKLLERTRARRENLQKKMAERPNAASRQMIKRPREPLADTNCVTSEPPADQVPHGSTKPSPSKRSCSGENVQPLGDENQNPVVSPPTASTLPNPPTDKKPPVMPTSDRPSSTQDKTDTLPVVQFQPGQLKTVQPVLGMMNPNLLPSFSGPSTSEAEAAPASPFLHRSKAHAASNSVPSAAAMKSRLQKLAEQRKCWDGNLDSPSDTTSPTPLKKQTEVLPAASSTTSSEMFLGRRGRLANLAATIGSWEDDLSHANIPRQNTKEKAGTAVSKFALRDATVSTASTARAEGCPVAMSAASSKSVPISSQSTTVVPQTPQKIDIPKSKSAQQPGANPQKRGDEPGFPSRPQKPGPSPSTSVIESPQKSQMLSKEVASPASPKRPALCAKPAIGGSSDVHEKAMSGAPVVKSFLERFGERCQEQNSQGSPAGGTVQAKTHTVTPSAYPHTRLLQERFRAAQAANTTSADLTQRQKLRESELAQIRSRVQKVNNLWENTNGQPEGKECSDVKFVKCVEVAPCQLETEPEVLSERMDTPTECPPTVPGPGLSSPPASTSSPLKVVPCTGEKPVADTLEQEVVKDLEMNVHQSDNSALINELFDGVLEQEDQEDEDEEDAFNISSMSLLTPLVETVAAAVKSPEREIMTSTPASSFIVKDSTPDRTPTPGKFHRSDLTQAASVPSDSAESMEDEHRLPYSIDAYRSTRVKDTERPIVKQVNLSKGNASNRADEPRASSLFSIKQKMKILTNEMNLQQTVIHQASQALNCCTDEEHGKGSQVEAEAERLLLMATEKREALKTELERLKGDPKEHRRDPEAPEPCGVSPSRALVTLHEFRLPLKADFVCSTANKPESTKHSFFLLIRAGAENTVASPLTSTHRGLSGDTLSFPMNFTISDVSSDFEIDIEVYCLVQKHEVCSDKKKKPIKSKTIWRQVLEAHDLCMSAITPKRFLTITKSVQTPVVASPGGPNAVRTSNFVLVGSHKLTLASVGKSKFPLEKIKYEGSERKLLSHMFHTKVPFLCPLEGHIHLKLQCEVGSKVEERGFLTMFEDVSGFGAWHRRWCVLSGYFISYWTYPDDEKRKNPIGHISLANCTSKRVEPAIREFCARPNTLELITVRPQREGDRETLVSQCKNSMCVTRNWLSADTKDERNLWMKKLNQILVDLRMWQPAAQRPL